MSRVEVPSATETRPARQAPGPLKRAMLTLLLLASLGYLAFVVRKDFEAFIAVLAALDLGMVALSVLSALVMMVLKALYHLDLCRALSERHVPAAPLLRAYATAQVVRYLPGKVWGVVYQASRLSDLGAGRIVTANLMQMLHTNLVAVGVIAGVLGSMVLERAWPLAALVLGLLVVEVLHRRPRLERMIVALVTRSQGRAEPQAAVVSPRPVRATTILALEWVAYYAMWWTLLAPVGWSEMLVPSTWYAAASLLAILAFVVPGGIGVREALFVSLAGGGFAPGAASLVALAAAMRLILLAGELVCIPVVDHLGRWIDRRAA